MLRYRLDDLGWFQFEALIQTLMKAELGIGVESWGGPGDHGRDAYFDGPLAFPGREEQTGPFLFQVKFVQGANAAGAEPRSALMRSIRAECRQIEHRRKLGTWPGVAHYLLLTNAPLSASLRDEITTALFEVGGAMSVHTHGESDVCDMLDQHPNLRKSFPQLLSIRDLEHLITQAVNKDILERSRMAYDCASDVVPVFVPTSAYDRAWKVLHKHRFVVLEGPPEMGKTAIAWMIGIVQILNSWEAIVCDTPQDFFRSYESRRSQVFIADDAFGRTEYEPSRGRQWEHDLDRVLRALDGHHWLLWTSRKHILERALRGLDLQGRASHFPDPAAVLVDASKFRVNEKALILYRHAKGASLRDVEVDLVKKYAPFIVHHRSFTPERIRRFVADRLPDFANALQDGESAQIIKAEIDEAVTNPTDRMRKTFRALSPAHKWLLVGLLECGHWPLEGAVRSAYEAHCPNTALSAFMEIADELRESFINVHSIIDDTHFSWVHPSYRDLVIEELSSDSSFRQSFLRTCSADGLILAVSEAGGVGGERRWPLMVDAEAWNLLEQRATELMQSVSTEQACDLLTSVTAAVESAEDSETRARLVVVLEGACETARVKWDAEATCLTGRQLRAFASATTCLAVLPKMPDLGISWDNGDHRLHGAIASAPEYPLVADDLEEWIDLVTAIDETEPRFISKRKFPSAYEDQIDLLLRRVDDECYAGDYEEAGDMRAEGGRLNTLANVVHRLVRFPGNHVEQSIDLQNRLREVVSDLNNAADELEDDEPDLEDDGGVHSAGFDVAALFSDL